VSGASSGLAKVPAEAVGNTGNDMYLASEAIRFLMKRGLAAGPTQQKRPV
jgi:hypothetical protein